MIKFLGALHPAAVHLPTALVLTAGLAEGAARRGERWRVFFYRAVLVLSSAAVVVTGHFGAVLAHGPGYLGIP